MDRIPDEYHTGTNVTVPLIAGRKANATFVLLARNSDLKGMISSIKQMGA